MIWAFLIAVVIFVGPFLLAKLIARLLRLKDISVRLGIVLLAATLGLAPFAAQWVLGVQEQNEYEAALAEWEQKLEQRQSNTGITDEGLEELRQTRPQLQIIRGGEGGDEGQFTAVGSDPAESPAPRTPAGGEPAPDAPAERSPAAGAPGSDTPADGRGSDMPPTPANPEGSR